MPSGREIHTVPDYRPPVLDPGALAQMRAPVDPDERTAAGQEDDSGDEADDGEAARPPGAFPGASTSNTSAYY